MGSVENPSQLRRLLNVDADRLRHVLLDLANRVRTVRSSEVLESALHKRASRHPNEGFQRRFNGRRPYLQPTPTSRELLVAVTSSRSVPNRAMLGIMTYPTNEPQTVRARQDPPPCHRLRPLTASEFIATLPRSAPPILSCCQGASKGLGRSSGCLGIDLHTCQACPALHLVGKRIAPSGMLDQHNLDWIGLLSR